MKSMEFIVYWPTTSELGVGFDKPSDTELEKTDFPLPIRYQVNGASWLGSEFCIYFLFSVLSYVQVLCITITVSING